MIYVLQIIIVLFLLGMIALWATYGFFSAFIQLIVVIAAGVFALAVWEPMTFFLLGRMPAYAHGVGLLAPFALALIVLRVAFDQLCRMNLHLPHLADQIGGGLCGLLAGILAFGMFLNGANFLPIERGAMGYEPYTMQGNDVEPNDKGRLMTFLRVNEWSAGFFTFLSGGAMSPTGGPGLDEVRPGLAKRAELYRIPVDTNQMKSAHPETVEVVGVYAIPATADAVKGMVERATLVFFLAPTYQSPSKLDFGADGLAQVKAIRSGLAKRFDDPGEHGRPDELINFDLIKEIATARRDAANATKDGLLAQIKAANEEGNANDKQIEALEDQVAEQEDILALFEPIAEQPRTQQSFDAMVAFATKTLTDKLLKDDAGKPNAFAQALSPDKTLFIVDTRWNDDRPGTFNEGKLRVAIPQVRLQVSERGELGMVPPVGYSIEYSPNTKGRTFTELLSTQHYVAYSQNTDFHMGWAFLLSPGQEPVRFFARELRFDLTELPDAEGEESSVVQNIGAVARVFGAPALPAPKQPDDVAAGGGEPAGVRVGSTNSFAMVSESLPTSFGGGTSTQIEADKTTEPWTLRDGKDDKIKPGRSGGRRSTIRNIFVSPDSRLIRIKMDDKQYQSLLGSFIGAAEGVHELRVTATDGNSYPGIGYVKMRADGLMEIDIRRDAAQRGLFPVELPRVASGEALYVYFQVPVNSTINALKIGGSEEVFEQPLAVEESGRR
ncbi:MAG: hypothetical protein ACE37H_11835 [Phycisphaeraceae bacterium]